MTTCAYCGLVEGHSKRCSVSKWDVPEERTGEAGHEGPQLSRCMWTRGDTRCRMIGAHDGTQHDYADPPPLTGPGVLTELACLLSIADREDVGGEASDLIKEYVANARDAYDRSRRNEAARDGEAAADPVAAFDAWWAQRPHGNDAVAELEAAREEDRRNEDERERIYRYGVFTPNLDYLRKALGLREGKHTADSVARIAVERLVLGRPEATSASGRTLAELEAGISSTGGESHMPVETPVRLGGGGGPGDGPAAQTGAHGSELKGANVAPSPRSSSPNACAPCAICGTDPDYPPKVAPTPSDAEVSGAAPPAVVALVREVYPAALEIDRLRRRVAELEAIVDEYRQART